MFIQEQDKFDLFFVVEKLFCKFPNVLVEAETETFPHRSQIFMIDQRLQHFARLVESIDARIFAQVLVEVARRRQEEYGRDIAQASLPLLTLCSLTAHIDESEWHVFNLYFGFDDC